ncbi:MAG TPA: ribosome maturation factor RimM [Gammaproteobacteria bacterium]|nr:ribosome maturation factor RimM [Gammaproteobacteria bacterium]
MSAKTDKTVTLGRISGVFGVKGWVKVHSYTEPRDNVVRFRTWTLKVHGGERRFDVEAGHAQGAGVVAKLSGLDDRDQARELIGADIVVERSELPPCAPGEYYWTDLEGLEVRTTTGQVLGTVDHLLATAGHDVLVLAGQPQRLIPFVQGRIIHEVDLDAGTIVADWSPDY